MQSIMNFWRKFSGKGYYIALIGCAALILVAAFLYSKSAKTEEQTLQNPTNQNLPVVSTDPTVGQLNKPTQTGLPLEGQTVMSYSMDKLSYDPTTRDWRTHAGIDIAAEAGAAVAAAADGVVYTTYDDELLGTTVVIRHEGGYMTTYASLAKELTVAPGDTVTLGQTIGYVGCSAMMETALGDHLHFAVSLNDDALDPQDFFALG